RQFDTGIDEFLVVHGDGGSAAAAHRVQDQLVAQRLGYAQPSGDSGCVLPELGTLVATLEGANHRLAACGLHHDHLRALAADPSESLHLIKGFPHADEAYASAGGVEDRIGQLPAE